MRSAQDPSTLPPGIWSYLQNVRPDAGSLKVRDGAVAVVASDISGASFRGACSATYNGTSYVFAAYRVGSNTKAYYLNGSAWTEISGVGSVLTTDGTVGFSVVRQEGIPGVQSASDVLVIGNGAQTALVSTTSVALDTVGAVVSLPVPANATATPVPYGAQQVAGTYQDLSLFAQTLVYVSTPAKFNGTAGSGYVGAQITADTTVTEGETVEFLWGSAQIYDGNHTDQGLTLQKEACIASSGVGDTLWNYVKTLSALVHASGSVAKTVTGTSASASAITVTTTAAHGYATGDYVVVDGVSGFACNGVFRITVTGSTTFTLDETSPSTGTGTGGTVRLLEWLTLYDATGIDSSLLLTEMEPVTGASVGTTTAYMATVTTDSYEGRTGWYGLRFTSSNVAPTVDQTFEIFFAGTSGALDGAARYAVAYYRASSFTEGVAQLATAKDGVTFESFGGTEIGRYYRWTPGANYRTAFWLNYPGSDDLTGAPNWALIYRSDPYLADDGSTLFGGFYLATTDALPTSEPTSGNDAYDVGGTPDVTRTAKEVGHLTMPAGTLHATANDRLFVAGTSSPTELWVSADRDPFSFRKVPLVDDSGNQLPTSATYRTFSGEKVTALLKLQGQVLGVDSVLVWTDRGLYRLGDYDSRTIMQAQRLGEKGTFRSPSVCAYDGAVWYLDTEGQARRSNGGLSAQAMSRLKVDDLLTAGTLTGAFAIVGYNGFRLFYQESGASDIRVCLVWREETGEWVIDRYPFALSGAVVHDVSPKRLMYVFGSAGKVWEIERAGQTTDAGTAIPIRLSAQEISQDGWAPLTFGTVGIVCDGSVNTTLATARYCPYDGTTTSGTIDLTTGNLTTTSAWRFDVTNTGGIPGTPVNPSCIPTLTGDMPGAKRVRTLNIEVLPRSGGADRV